MLSNVFGPVLMFPLGTHRTPLSRGTPKASVMHSNLSRGSLTPATGPRKPTPLTAQTTKDALALDESQSPGRATWREVLNFKVAPRDVTEDYDVVFWLGDFNYRVEGNRRGVDHAMKHQMWEVLHANDQLRREMHRGRVFKVGWPGVAVELCLLVVWRLSSDCKALQGASMSASVFGLVYVQSFLDESGARRPLPLPCCGSMLSGA